jgi:hypothetical protein
MVRDIKEGSKVLLDSLRSLDRELRPIVGGSHARPVFVNGRGDFSNNEVAALGHAS